jgi:hypothetical protein
VFPILRVQRAWTRGAFGKTSASVGLTAASVRDCTPYNDMNISKISHTGPFRTPSSGDFDGPSDRLMAVLRMAVHFSDKQIREFVCLMTCAIPQVCRLE